MTEGGVVPTAEPYSPKRRTALVLSGTGTAGAYHAGVLRALHEAGVKIDIVAGRGVGVVGALFAAIDGAQSLWDREGFWQRAPAGGFYPWRTSLRALGWALALSVAIVAVPLAAMGLGFVVFPIDFLLKMVGVSASAGLTGPYVRLAERAFAPEGLPTWLPRLVVLVIGAAALAVAVEASVRAGRAGEWRAGFWWRVVPSPLSSTEAIAHTWSKLWDLIRGGTQLKAPAPLDLARRYVELLTDNLGHPGFREFLTVVHDVDAGRDLVCALVVESRRRDLIRRERTEDAEARRAEVLDLAGPARDHLVDVVAAALTTPIAGSFHTIHFAPESFWCGEPHRLSDRPGALERVVDELMGLGVEQLVLVSAAPRAHGPFAIVPPRLDGRGRLGEFLQSAESSHVRDVLARRAGTGLRMFGIQPVHNPVGPFDFAGTVDARSARTHTLAELMDRGYADAYHQFVEPVVGASGDRMGQVG